MLPKPHIDFNVFYLISLESRDLLGLYCRASIVYDICFFNVDFNTKFYQSYFRRKRSWRDGTVSH